MASKRSRSNPKTKSITSAPARVQRFAFFGPPPLLEGEDAALYDDLVGRMCAAVKPVDIIDELYVADVVSLEWEIMRWRRLKFSLLQASVHDELEELLERAARLRGVRRSLCGSSCGNSSGNSSERSCARRSERAGAPVRPIATGRCQEGQGAFSRLPDCTWTRSWTRQRPKGRKSLSKSTRGANRGQSSWSNELLASSGRTMHDLMFEALSENLDEIERIDRLITIAETRRNVSLREIDRRRAVLGEALRRNVQEVEEGEFEVIETTPAEGQSPA